MDFSIYEANVTTNHRNHDWLQRDSIQLHFIHYGLFSTAILTYYLFQAKENKITSFYEFF